MNRIRYNWHLMRILRALLGASIILQAIQTRNDLSLLFGAVFLITAIFNVACCGAVSCAAPVQNSESGIEVPVVFEEVKESVPGKMKEAGHNK